MHIENTRESMVFVLCLEIVRFLGTPFAHYSLMVISHLDSFVV